MLKSIKKKLPWRLQSIVGLRPNKVYTDIFDFQRTGHPSLVSIKKIDSAKSLNLELPKFHNVELPERFHMNHFKAYPDVYLAELKNCTVGITQFRVGIITANNGLILDLSPDHAKKEIHPFLSCADCSPQKAFSGKTLILAAPAGKGNYYHWMFHVIGRLSVLKALEIDINTFDHIVVNKTYKTFQEQSLVDFNLPKQKLVFLDENDFYRIENAYIPSYLYFHPMAPHFLKRSYLRNVSPSCFGKKIYISRRKSSIRKLEEEDALVSMLIKDFGYKEVFLEDHTIQEQANIMNGAEFVITPHGAGLPNVIYCKPKTKVLEILPYTWLNVIYWIYGEYAQLDYAVYMAGQPSDISDGYKNFNLDVNDFKAFLLKSGF